MKKAVIFLLSFLIEYSRAISWSDGDGTTWSFACDFKGGDIGSSQVSGENCGLKCGQTSGCTHFTWTSYNGGTCWMKGGQVSTSNAISTNDRGMVCGIMKSTGMTWYHGDGTEWTFQCDFKGNDIASKSGGGETCGSACAQQSGCTHFVWSSYNKGTCWLKSGQVSKSNAFKTSDSSMLCGIMSNNQQTGCGLFGNGKLGVGINYNSISQVNVNDYDYITIWLNTPASDTGSTNFNPYYQGSMLDKCKETGKMPAFYAYVIAFEGRSQWKLNDCDNDNTGNNLCNNGACFIQNKRNDIVARYAHQSSEIAKRYGTDKPVLFLMEPDYWQYFGDPKQKCKLDWGYARELFRDFVIQIKKNLPRAIISWDISAWLDQNTMKGWWNTFGSCQECAIDYINNSGGQSRADSSNIKPNELTYSFMSQLTGRKIISDCGYGVGGQPDDSCRNWQNQNNLNNRINDGVVAVSVANPVGGTYPRLQIKC